MVENCSRQGLQMAIEENNVSLNAQGKKIFEINKYVRYNSPAEHQLALHKDTKCGKKEKATQCFGVPNDQL